MKGIISVLLAVFITCLTPYLCAGEEWGDDWSEPWEEDSEQKPEESNKDDRDQEDPPKRSKSHKQKKYMYFDIAGLGGVGVDLRAGLAYAYTPNDEEQTQRVGFDLAAGIYYQIWGFRSANYFHFESTFGIDETKEDQYRFGFRNDFLYHTRKGLDWGIGGSIAFFQIAATSHDNEVMWNPELALVADLWHFGLRIPVQFYAGSEPGVGFGPTIVGYFQ